MALAIRSFLLLATAITPLFSIAFFSAKALAFSGFLCYHKVTHAGIVLYALGIELPAFEETGWTSQVPGGLFEGATLPPYRDISHLTGAAPRRSQTPHTSKLV